MRNSLQKRTWAEVSLDNISHNYRAIRAALPEGCRFLGVVKADAYGHGAVAVARLLESEGADYLAVSCLDEAMELRSAGITMPLLILGHTPSEYTETLIDNDITQTVSCLAKAQEFSARAAALGRQLRIHIKIDTGMSRLGFLCGGDSFDEGVDNVIASCRLPGLLPEGIYTHFAVSDEPDADSERYTHQQFDLFCRMIDAVARRGGVTFAIRHCANTGAVVHYPEMALDMVRPGLLLYGYGDDTGRFGRACALSPPSAPSKPTGRTPASATAAASVPSAAPAWPCWASATPMVCSARCPASAASPWRAIRPPSAAVSAWICA